MDIYKHLTLDERFRLDSLLKENYEQGEIAEILGRNSGSVSRELSRNSKPDGTYEARYAHKQAKVRRKNSKLGSRKIENDKELQRKIKKRLEPLVSPEVVCHDDDIDCCFASVYNWIYRSESQLRKQLPYQGKKRRKYGTKREKKQGWTQYVRPIEDLQKTQYIWEGDTVKGSTKDQLLTHVEQKSLFLRVDLIPDGTANSVYETLKKDPLDGNIIYDRGSEFALWKMIETAIHCLIFFAAPHHPWQRPKNENTNGRLRRVFPKKFNFSIITQKEVDVVVWKMNHTKRKSLNWRTPCEVYGCCCTST